MTLYFVQLPCISAADFEIYRSDGETGDLMALGVALLVSNHNTNEDPRACGHESIKSASPRNLQLREHNPAFVVSLNVPIGDRGIK